MNKDLILKNKNYCLTRIDLSSLQDFFEKLSPDKYTKGEFAFRFRAYSKVRFSNNLIVWLPKDIFFQSKLLNPYAGGIKREFDEIPSGVKEHLEKIVLSLITTFPIGEYEIGLHMIRTLADNDHKGDPSPEGIHQDGVDYVTIGCVSCKNISGAITSLLTSKSRSNTVLQKTLEEGEILILDDKKLFHYTSAITPLLPGRAYRDVLIMTFRKIF